ncbi:MAG: glycosyl hydrolase [Bryobacteraceae bacterium]
MGTRLPLLSALLLPALFRMLGAAAAPPEPVAELHRAFENPPADSRIMMRWWWFGAAVVTPELERELRTMKEAGIGGVEIQPVYPVVLDDPGRGLVNLPYLSDGFLDALRFANDKARELGLRVDLTLCSGWPYGGPHTPIDLASGHLRFVGAGKTDGGEVQLPKLGAGEKLIAAFDRSTPEFRQLDPHQLAGHSSVWFFIASPTRQAVKRAAAGAEGLVLDHYNRAAIENHLRFVGDRLMQAFGDHPPYAIFSDSLEVYGADWTGDFLSEFQKRRGYDLTPHLPALAGDMGAKTLAIRHDWGLTLTELANEHYLTPLREWAAAHHTRFRSQTYGIPPVSLSSNALVDLPEGEGSAWRHFTATRWASSASHLYGRPVTSSETWTWLHSPVFRATPLDMKAEADRHFLMGINQLIGHGWPYSPPQAGEPGWHFYAAAVFNAHNPWFMAMPDIARYLQRISFLLRQGTPVTDVALYLPTADAYAGFTLGHDSVDQAMDRLIGPDVVPGILDAGYNFDCIDDGAIARLGIPYPVLILPPVERIPLASLRKIEEYVRQGGIAIAIGRAPSLAPGFKEADTDTPAIRQISQRLFQAAGAPGHLLRDGAKLGDTLRAALPPDMASAPEVGFVHRKLPSADIYFAVNSTNHRAHHEAVFRVKDMNGAWWDPFSGKAAGAGGARIDLDLAPYESRVIVFSHSGIPAPAAGAPPAAVADWSRGWRLTFPGAATLSLESLRSWTDIEGRANYSGQATYEKKVTVDPSLLAHRALYLDFGEGTPVAVDGRRSGSGMRALLESPIREAARVSVNGTDAGSVWCAPYRVEVTGLLHPGENTVRVLVANLALSGLAAQPLPDYRPLIAKYGNRFQDQDMKDAKPQPAGMLGPVRLLGR